MHNHKSFLAIIPARGGSKRLPRKNLLELNGKPLISWSIEAGQKSKYIDEVIVTSDDDEILTVSKKCGCKVIKRPPELASDLSTTFEAIEHVINSTKKYDYIVLLQPTSPLRTAVNIDEAIELLETKNADAIVSVSETEHSPLWCNILPEDGSMKGFLKSELKNVRSQDLPVFYRLNGAIYIIKCENLLDEKTFMIDENIFSYVMSASASIDIDSELDFKLANAIIGVE